MSIIQEGDRVFALREGVWGTAKVVIPEATQPVLFVQDDFEYDWWGCFHEFESEVEYNTRIDGEETRERLNRERKANEQKADAARSELLYLLGQFVDGTSLREAIRSSFQVRYVCPICRESLLVDKDDTMEETPMELLKHDPKCLWFRAYELLNSFKISHEHAATIREYES